MADEFDPAEFDAVPPASDSDTDHRALLDAIRQAGTDGVAAQTAALVRTIEQDAAKRENWMKEVHAGLSEIRSASADLERRARRLDMMVLMRVILAAFALVFVVIVYQWLREPKVIERPFGCTSGWDAKKGACRGKWVPLQFNEP